MSIFSSAQRVRPYRGSGLWPFLAFVLGIAAFDQILLRFDLVRLSPESTAEWSLAWQAPFRNAAARFDPGRPQLLVVGSSRAETILPPYLERAAREAGLPHQVSNLGVSFGTPALIWSGLNELTPFTREWPGGSRVIYVFSTHELPGLQPQKLVTTAFGRELLLRHVPMAQVDRLLNDVPADELRSRWSRIAYPYSGIVQLMIKAPMLLPDWITRIKNLRWIRAVNFSLDPSPPAERSASPECMQPAEAGHPANLEALNAMAAYFGPSFVIVFPPRHPVSRRCSLVADQAAATLVENLLRRTGGRSITNPDDLARLPIEDFKDDGEHVVSDHGRRAVAEALIRLVR
jgi:hypothetical protein